MDASELAQKMLKWERGKRKLDKLESEIEAAVLEIGKTQTVGKVRATFSQGRTTFDDMGTVQAAHGDAIAIGDGNRLAEIQTAIDMHTETTATTNWRNVCETLSLERLVRTPGKPSVTVKMLK